MSKLSFIGRPWIAFDPSIKEHRRWFAEYQRKGTWGTCPVRFVIPDSAGDLVSMIQRMLIEYYVAKEFQVSSKVLPDLPREKLVKFG